VIGATQLEIVIRGVCPNALLSSNPFLTFGNRSDHNTSYHDLELRCAYHMVAASILRPFPCTFLTFGRCISEFKDFLCLLKQGGIDWMDILSGVLTEGGTLLADFSSFAHNDLVLDFPTRSLES